MLPCSRVAHDAKEGRGSLATFSQTPAPLNGPSFWELREQQLNGGRHGRGEHLALFLAENYLAISLSACMCGEGVSRDDLPVG